MIVREELVLKLDLVTLMVVKEIVITYCMASHSLALRMGLHWREHPLTHTYTHIDFQLRPLLFVPSCQCG